jgi:hypothetical protein
LGTETKDPQGRDLRIVSEPKEITKFREAINPHDHRTFFGGLGSSKLGFQRRMIRKLLAGRTLLPEGHFCDRNDIEACAISIVQELEVPRRISESETEAG